MIAFHLIRRCDGLTYRFVADPKRSRVFARLDHPDLTIIWDDHAGWIMRDPDSGVLVGRVWDIDPRDQPEHPPETVWVTAKGDKSYVYDLHAGAGTEGA